MIVVKLLLRKDHLWGETVYKEKTRESCPFVKEVYVLCGRKTLSWITPAQAGMG